MFLVEDNPADVQILQYGLEEAYASYSLQVATDGEEAVSLLRTISRSDAASQPDLILLDLNLPRRNGHEVLAMIKADAVLRLIPVIVLTSSQARADILAAYSHGASSYLQKPTDFETMLDLMRTVEHYWLDLAFLPNA